MANDM
jgi:vacuolar protein sorting-associated protein 11